MEIADQRWALSYKRSNTRYVDAQHCNRTRINYCMMEKKPAHECQAQTFHSLPAVRKHFDSYFFPNELVSVAHPETKSLAQTPQSTGAVTPAQSYKVLSIAFN